LAGEAKFNPKSTHCFAFIRFLCFLRQLIFAVSLKSNSSRTRDGADDATGRLTLPWGPAQKRDGA
jgi:hypothetical protein